jgi:hypothetical protein
LARDGKQHADLSIFFWTPNYDPVVFTFFRKNIEVASLGSYTTVAGVARPAPDFKGLV